MYELLCRSGSLCWGADGQVLGLIVDGTVSILRCTVLPTILGGGGLTNHDYCELCIQDTFETKLVAGELTEISVLLFLFLYLNFLKFFFPEVIYLQWEYTRYS